MFLRMNVAIGERLRALTDWRALTELANRDRGEGPVPYLIMVGVVAIGAGAIAATVILTARGWARDLPDVAPALPAAP